MSFYDLPDQWVPLPGMSILYPCADGFKCFSQCESLSALQEHTNLRVEFLCFLGVELTRVFLSIPHRLVV